MRTDTVNILGNVPAAKAGLAFAWIGVLIYAASNSIATLLVDIGADTPQAGGRNAITFANLLLLGSIISLIPLVCLFRGDWTRANLRKLSRRDWALLQFSALMSSAVTPGLFIFALENSNVTNVVLVSRIEPPLFLLAAGLFLKERIDPRALVAGLIALCGAMLMISMRGAGNHCVFDIGEIAAAGATLSYVISAIIARRALQRIPMGIFSIYRTAAGTVLYFLLISALRGPDTFQDVFSPVLLKWVWLYAVPVVVIGQLVWFFALKYARSCDMSLSASFSPLAGIVFAMLLLGENPGPGFLPGAALILLAICIARANSPVMVWLRRAWRRRPTYDAGEIATVLVPVDAFPGGMRRRYNGSY